MRVSLAPMSASAYRRWVVSPTPPVALTGTAAFTSCATSSRPRTLVFGSVVWPLSCKFTATRTGAVRTLDKSISAVPLLLFGLSSPTARSRSTLSSNESQLCQALRASIKPSPRLRFSNCACAPPNALLPGPRLHTVCGVSTAPRFSPPSRPRSLLSTICVQPAPYVPDRSLRALRP